MQIVNSEKRKDQVSPSVVHCSRLIDWVFEVAYGVKQLQNGDEEKAAWLGSFILGVVLGMIGLIPEWRKGRSSTVWGL